MWKLDCTNTKKLFSFKFNPRSRDGVEIDGHRRKFMNPRSRLESQYENEATARGACRWRIGAESGLGWSRVLISRGPLALIQSFLARLDRIFALDLSFPTLGKYNSFRYLP